MLPRPQAESSIFKSKVTVFQYMDHPKSVNNLFIFSKLSNEKKKSGKKLTQALL